MEKFDIRKFLKKIMVLMIFGLILFIYYLYLGSTTVIVVSETDKIKLDKVTCLYSADPLVEMRTIKDLPNHVFYQKGMRYGKYYYINVFDGNRTHLIKLTEFKSNWYQRAHIKIYVNDLKEPYIHIRVICDGIEEVNEKFDTTLDEKDVGDVE